MGIINRRRPGLAARARLYPRTGQQQPRRDRYVFSSEGVTFRRFGHDTIQRKRIGRNTRVVLRKLTSTSFICYLHPGHKTVQHNRRMNSKIEPTRISHTMQNGTACEYSCASGKHHMVVLLNSLELDRRCEWDPKNLCEEFKPCVAFLPPPQKFLPRGKGIADVSGVEDSRVLSARYKEFYCRAVGRMIAREECAQWLGGEEERRRSATETASLILTHDYHTSTL